MAEDSEGEASSVRERRVSGRRGGSPTPGADRGLLGGAGGRGGGGDGNDPFPFMTGGRFHACSSCRREKSKCDGDYPCGRCVRHCLSCLPQQYDRGTHSGQAAAGGAPLVRKKPGRKPKRKGPLAAAAAAAAAAAGMQPEEADGEESVATGVGSRPRPQLFGPPPVIQMAFRRAEPKALTEGLLAAVKALAEEGDVDRRLALRWLRTWRQLSRHVGRDVTLGAADGIMALLHIAASDVDPDGGVVGERRSGSPLAMTPAAVGGAGGGEDGEEADEEARWDAAEHVAVGANVLLPRAALREAPAYRILEAQQAAAVVWRLDRRGRQGAVATGAHARALRTTAELFEDVMARRTLPLFSMGSMVATEDRPAWFRMWAVLLFSASRRTATELIKAISREGRVTLFLLKAHRRLQEEEEEDDDNDGNEGDGDSARGLDLWIEVEPAPISRYTTDEAEGGGRSIVRRFRRLRPWEDRGEQQEQGQQEQGAGVGVGGGKKKKGKGGAKEGGAAAGGQEAEGGGEAEGSQQSAGAAADPLLVRPVGALPVPPLGEHEKTALLAAVADAGRSRGRGQGQSQPPSQAEAIFPRLDAQECAARTAAVPALPGPKRLSDQERVERKRERRRLYMAWRRDKERRARAVGREAAAAEEAKEAAAAAVMASGFSEAGGLKGEGGRAPSVPPPPVPPAKKKRKSKKEKEQEKAQAAAALQQQHMAAYQHMAAAQSMVAMYGPAAAAAAAAPFALGHPAFGLPPHAAVNPFMVYVQGAPATDAAQLQQQQQLAAFQQQQAVVWGSQPPYSPTMRWGAGSPGLSAAAMAVWSAAAGARATPSPVGMQQGDGGSGGGGQGDGDPADAEEGSPGGQEQQQQEHEV